MTDLEKIIEKGVLKDGEEIYLSYREEEFKGRIIERGKKIRTSLGDFTSPSAAASFFYSLNEKCKIKRLNPNGTYPANGWRDWKNWAGISLDKLRGKIK